MPLARWTRLRQQFEIRNRWWTYRKDLVRLPSGAPGEYHYVHTNGASMVIPVLGDGRLILVNQYRYLLDRESAEFPCGGVKDGSSHPDTAMGELAEETGYAAGDLRCVGEFDPYNGVADEICKVYVARDLRPVAARGDETEEFEQVILTPDELEHAIRAGTVWDGMTLAAWALARHTL
jgi:ADP-ribose pyrophosphatase